jgi:Flp pilus assembly protein CpaB
VVRSAFVFWLATCGLGATTGVVVSRSLALAQAAERRYGRTRPVVAVRHDVEAGHALAGSDVEVVDVPAIYVPPRTLSSTDAVVGRLTIVPLFAGEMIVEGQVAGKGAKGLSALLPAGTRAVSVALGRNGLHLRRGDRVDILATFDKDDAAAEPTFAVASAATVVDATDDAVTVAVSPGEAARVAYALAKGTVTVAATSAPPHR